MVLQMKNKICSKCKNVFPVNNFHKDKNSADGLYPICKECRKLESRKYYEKHKDHIIKTRQIYYENNKDLIAEQHKKYYTQNREEILKKRKKYRIDNAEKISASKKITYSKKPEHYKESKRIWKNKNRVKLNDQQKERLSNDPVFKLKHYIRCNIYDSFVRKKYKKYEKTEKIIGCSLDFLCNYLRETYYKNYGVEYDGTQNVHIDHIVPLSTAKTEKDVYRLCHYTNLQLLNAKDNLRKSDKLDFVL